MATRTRVRRTTFALKLADAIIVGFEGPAAEVVRMTFFTCIQRFFSLE